MHRVIAGVSASRPVPSDSPDRMDTRMQGMSLVSVAIRLISRSCPEAVCHASISSPDQA